MRQRCYFSLLGIGCCAALFWLPGTAIQKFARDSQGARCRLHPYRAAAAFRTRAAGGRSLVRVQPLSSCPPEFICRAGDRLGSMTNGFAAVQDFRSSKTLIEIANSRLGPTTLWTFEGSRELGAAGAMIFLTLMVSIICLTSQKSQTVERYLQDGSKASRAPTGSLWFWLIVGLTASRHSFLAQPRTI